MSEKLNIQKNKHINIRKNIITLLLLFSLFLSLSAVSYAKSVSKDLQKNIFRLHVLANSNTEEDQALKYKVRDSLISYMDNICSNLEKKEEVIVKSDEVLLLEEIRDLLKKEKKGKNK